MSKQGISKATPIEVKRQRGTGNSTRERLKAEPEYPAITDSIPMPPAHLNDGAAELWTRITMQLGSIPGLLFPSCFEYVDGYCRQWMIREEAWGDIQRNGYTVETDVGVRINPQLKVFQEAQSQMVVLGAKLGLSPVDKTKVSTGAIGKNTDKNNQKSVRGSR